MTTNTPAPAHQAVLTDDEINDICERPASNTTMRAENDRALARATEQALLSKLRAPVADERAAQRNEGFSSLSLWWTMIEAEAELAGEPIKDDEPILHFMGSGASHHVTAGDIRAALASAPVAGEAQRLDAPAQVGGTRFGKGIHWSTVIHAAQRHHEYMQDPACEAARIAQAKQFQSLVAGDAEPQAGEAQCSCPSGDGSLRHPCAVHPQASEAVRDAVKSCGSKVIKALSAIALADGPDMRKANDPELIYRSPVMDEVLRIRQAHDELDAALSAQPGAQKNGGSDA